MEGPLLKPRPAVKAFFEQFDDELVDHFTDDGTFDPDLVEILDPYWETSEFQSANLKFWVENEKRLHEKSGDGDALVRLDVDLMMSVYMFDVFYCLSNDDQEPVMAAYDFVVANRNWFMDNQFDLYEDGTLFQKVLDTLKSEVFFGEGLMKWINSLKDRTTLANEPKTLTELKEAIRIVTESPDRGGAIVPSGDPPFAIKRFIDTARPVFEVLVLPATAVSALLGAFVAGSDETIRRTANFRNLTETEPETQNFDSGSNEIELAYYREKLAYQKERARQRDEKTRLDQVNQRREAARAQARRNQKALSYSVADPRCSDAACAFGLDDDQRFVDLRDRLTYRGPPRVSDTEGPYPAEGDFVGPGVPGEEGDGTELDEDETVIELSTDNADDEEYADFRETPNLQNDFSQLGPPGNGTIPRLLNQYRPNGSRTFNWTASDSDSLARRLLYGQQRGTAFDVDPNAVDFDIDPELLRRIFEENQSDAQDDGNGTFTRRIETPSGNGSAFGSVEVGPNGPVRRPISWNDAGEAVIGLGAEVLVAPFEAAETFVRMGAGIAGGQ